MDSVNAGPDQRAVILLLIASMECVLIVYSANDCSTNRTVKLRIRSKLVDSAKRMDYVAFVLLDLEIAQC